MTAKHALRVSREQVVDQDLMKVVIMAGGKGTRIAGEYADIPKPMIPVAGKPVLEHQLTVFRDQGFPDIVLSVGYFGHVIQNHFGDGSALGVHITYVEEQTPLGTAGALFHLKDILTEDFMLVNGDLIFDVDIARFAAFHRDNEGLATIFTHPNDHPFDSGIIFTDAAHRVTRWLHREDERGWYHNRVNAGLHMLSPKLLEFPMFSSERKVDLDRDLLRPLIESGQLTAYNSPEYVKDMGTPERCREVEADILSGRVAGKNLSKKQKAVFLDRDGTINKYVGFLTDISDLRLLEGSAEAIRRINRSGYLAIVVTNQPVIARGDVTFEELDEIHAKMETLLGEQGAYIDAIYCCPHHPDKGFAGEVPELKIECECRKPKPGLLLQTAKDFNIDLESSWMIGDSERDVLAGKQAGCRTILLQGSLLDAVRRMDLSEESGRIE